MLDAMLRRPPLFAAVAAALLSQAAAAPFTLQGPGVNAGDFRVTTFASGLSYPLGMAELPDGSLLVTLVANSGFFSGTNPGRLVRYTDANQDGIADGAGTILHAGLPNSLSSLRVAGNLVFLTGPPHPIMVFRMGATPADPLTLAGKLIITYPGGWTINYHQHSELAVRKTPGFANRYDIFFQVGAKANFAATTDTATLTNDNIPGVDGGLAGDSIHMITIADNGSSFTAISRTQIASGLRNAAGMDFHPATGDLYFQDNGIDALTGTDQHGADELNRIVRADLGGAVEFFGFPANYTAYRTNTFVGGAGIPPLINFQPIPNPATGAKSEGPNQISFAPPGFPDGLNNGLFIGFHGRFNSGGTANDENPLVYANPATADYFHFIAGQQTGIGHLDGLLATRDSLFVADLATNGSLFADSNTGAIYQIKSLVTPSPPPLTIERIDTSFRLDWSRGTLLQADDPGGTWTEVTDAFAPLLLQPAEDRKFYRIAY